METFFVYKVSFLTFAHSMKENIIQHITPNFLTNGYKSLTMDDVANEMGMSKKTLYSYFKSKEELVRAVMEEVSKTIQSFIVETQEANLGAVEEFTTLERRINDFFAGKEQRRCVSELRRYYPKVYKSAYNYQLEEVMGFIRNNLKKGKNSGEYRTEINEEHITFMFATVMLGFKSSELLKNEDDYKQVMYDFSEIFMRGICTLKGIEEYENITTKVYEQ